MSYQLKVEKVIGRPPGEVFNALGQGLLFMNCGADCETIKVDFRQGGKYYLEFKNHSVSNRGEFLEIIPNKKIVFSWCQTFDAKSNPDTTVTIELFPEGDKTKLVLVHTGFNDQANCANHEKGWTGGLTDMGAQIQDGRLRMIRTFKTPVENLFNICKDPESFFAFMGDISKGNVDFKVGGKYQVPTQSGEIKGEFLEIIPNKKISLSWLIGCSGPLNGSNVTLLFTSKDDGASSLELIHDGLKTEKDQTAHRFGWETVTKKMNQALRN